jgi:hypothetical protein
MLRLPWDSQMERPTIPPEWDLEAGRLAESIGMPIGASVVLFPANTTRHAQFPDLFWETLAARLTKNGQAVFTNMKGGTVRPKTMPIAGTRPVEVPVHLALSLVRLADMLFAWNAIFAVARRQVQADDRNYAHRQSTRRYQFKLT